jgi:hypothetical protein
MFCYVSSWSTHAATIGTVKNFNDADDFIGNLFAMHILDAIRDHYHLDKSDMVGFGINHSEIQLITENSETYYKVKFVIETELPGKQKNGGLDEITFKITNSLKLLSSFYPDRNIKLESYIEG